MSPEREVEIIVAVAKVGRKPILEHFRRDSCIASSRIALDVLSFFGVQGEPMPLFMVLMNDQVLKLMEAGWSQDEISAELKRHRVDELGGPWSIGVGAEIKNSSGWAGHLMVGIKQRLLLDLSFDQASRPHKGLTFLDEGQVFPVLEPAWWVGEETRVAFTGTNKDGERVGFILDRICPDPDGYRHTLNWRRDGNLPGTRRAFKEVTGQIIRLVKAELEEE